MSPSPERPPLSSCAVRIVAALCADSTPITVVIVGRSVAIHGHLSFAHGSRVAVVVQSSVDDLEQARGTVVITALSNGLVFSLSGVIRDAAERSLSLDLYGDLRGSDPRHFDRTIVPGDVRVSVSWDEHSVVGSLRDVSEQGIAVVVSEGASVPPDGAAVLLESGSARGPVGARVCHRIDGLDGPGHVRIGLGLSTGSDGRVFSQASGAVPAQ